MREIVLDTETTGFEPAEGDRIVEIGAIELVNHMPTGRTYHQYINPKRSMPLGAYEIHGIGPDLREPPEDPKPGQVTLRDIAADGSGAGHVGDCAQEISRLTRVT